MGGAVSWSSFEAHSVAESVANASDTLQKKRAEEITQVTAVILQFVIEGLDRRMFAFKDPSDLQTIPVDVAQGRCFRHGATHVVSNCRDVSADIIFAAVEKAQQTLQKKSDSQARMSTPAEQSYAWTLWFNERAEEADDPCPIPRQLCVRLCRSSQQATGALV